MWILLCVVLGVSGLMILSHAIVFGGIIGLVLGTPMAIGFAIVWVLIGKEILNDYE